MSYWFFCNCTLQNLTFMKVLVNTISNSKFRSESDKLVKISRSKLCLEWIKFWIKVISYTLNQPGSFSIIKKIFYFFASFLDIHGYLCLISRPKRDSIKRFIKEIKNNVSCFCWTNQWKERKRFLLMNDS